MYQGAYVKKRRKSRVRMNRATVLLMAILMLIGVVAGMLGSLLMPRLAEAAGYPAGFLAGAAALLLLGLVCLGLRPARSAAVPVEEPAQASNAVG